MGILLQSRRNTMYPRDILQKWNNVVQLWKTFELDDSNNDDNVASTATVASDDDGLKTENCVTF